jgi:hypothetical protein
MRVFVGTELFANGTYDTVEEAEQAYNAAVAKRNATC